MGIPAKELSWFMEPACEDSDDGDSCHLQGQVHEAPFEAGGWLQA